MLYRYIKTLYKYIIVQMFTNILKCHQYDSLVHDKVHIKIVLKTILNINSNSKYPPISLFFP